MKITIKELKLIIKELLNKENVDTENDDVYELDEVDTDPSNNPGRPADAYDYVGMRPNAAWAMSHPSLSGGGGDSSGVQEIIIRKKRI